MDAAVDDGTASVSAGERPTPGARPGRCAVGFACTCAGVGGGGGDGGSREVESPRLDGGGEATAGRTGAEVATGREGGGEGPGGGGRSGGGRGGGGKA